MIVGMDFGTTNSGLAVYDGQRLQLLPIDPANANPRVARTALYLTNDQSLTIGRAAVDTYFSHNLGRPVRMERTWVGEISVAWADQFRWIRDVYLWVDALAPGRLFLSIKTGLRELDYVGTVVGRYFYPLEDLIALYLHTVKLRAERLLDQELHEIVLGRPVHFALDPEQDAMAEGRLVNAALRAGYERVYLEFEPVAAAYHYERTLERPQNVLVFDFGGGTLDFTVMRLGSGRGRQVLAVGGIPVAGDAFDQKLVRAKLPRHFGEGSVYGPRGREQPVPEWIYESFASWQSIITLQTPEHIAMLREMARTAREPRKLEALISMVSSHYGLKMFDTVELTKRMLSRRDEALIRLAGQRFDIAQPVTRGEFENILHDDVQNVERGLDEVLRASGLAPGQIDAVIRTGGSSQIPVFQRLLDRKFGPEKVRSIDIFSSVASGLGIIAHGIEAGEVAARSFSREQMQGGEGPAATGLGARVPRVDLDLVLKRLAAEEEAPEAVNGSRDAENTQKAAPGGAGGRADTATSATLSLVIHLRDGSLIVTEVARSALAARRDIALPHGSGPAPGREPTDGAAAGAGAATTERDGTPRRVLALDPGDHVLIVTSRFRFLLVSWRQLRSYDEQGVSLAAVERLAPEETFAAIAHWESLRECSRLLIISSKGFARWYRLEFAARGHRGSQSVPAGSPGAGCAGRSPRRRRWGRSGGVRRGRPRAAHARPRGLRAGQPRAQRDRPRAGAAGASHRRGAGDPAADRRRLRQAHSQRPDPRRREAQQPGPGLAGPAPGGRRLPAAAGGLWRRRCLPTHPVGCAGSAHGYRRVGGHLAPPGAAEARADRNGGPAVPEDTTLAQAGGRRGDGRAPGIVTKRTMCLA